MLSLSIIAITTYAAWADANAPRAYVDDATFAQIADRYAYDANLPLEGKVLDVRVFNGRELPYAVDKVHFRSTHDQTVTGFFAHSRDTTAAPAPAVILLHGNNGSQGVNHIWGNRWLDILAHAGYCVLAIDAYGYGERMLPGRNYYPGPYEERDKLVQQIVDTRRAIADLHSRPEVDTARIALVGESMGGFIGIRTAGLENRLAALVLIVMASGGHDPLDPFWRSTHPLNFAPRVSAPVLMVNATEDQYFSKESTEEIYAALPQPKEIIWRESEHVILVPDQQKTILPWLDQRLK